MCVCMKWGYREIVFYKSDFPVTPIDRKGDIGYICVDVMSYDVVGAVVVRVLISFLVLKTTGEF
jgi:hypothetical protein